MTLLFIVFISAIATMVAFYKIKTYLHIRKIKKDFFNQEQNDPYKHYNNARSEVYSQVYSQVHINLESNIEE